MIIILYDQLQVDLVSIITGIMLTRWAVALDIFDEKDLERRLNNFHVENYMTFYRVQLEM